MSFREPTYQHTQRAVLCLPIYAAGVAMLAVTGMVPAMPSARWACVAAGLAMLLVAGSFHYLAVEDVGRQLLVRFGPIPLLRRRIRYADIVSAEQGRTMFLEGWGVHLDPRGGWVWNIWGRDCVVLRFTNGGVLRIGTDDPENLARFLADRAGRD